MHAGKIRNCVFLMKMSKYGEGLIDIHFSHLTELLKVTKTELSYCHRQGRRQDLAESAKTVHNFMWLIYSQTFS